MIPRLLALVMVAALPSPAAACGTYVGLKGSLTIPQCTTDAGADCVPGGQAVYDAMQALETPGEFSIGLQSSPWRMYDPAGRILTIEEVASAVRAQRSNEAKQVRLVGSWTSALPDGGDATLARRLSQALDEFPVEGFDGFLWLSPTGATRTTRQAYSVWKSGRYQVRAGDDVMIAFVPGAMAQFEDHFAGNQSADGVLQAGIGHDVFGLCPERARAAFERAAAMGSSAGAYNAGLMHAERGNVDSARVWLEKAEALGEAKAGLVMAALGDGAE